MTNRALQEAYKDDVNWQHEVILDVRDENGDSVVQIPLPESPVTDAAVGEYRIVNGQLVDENGTVLPLDSSVNLTGLPDNSTASVENRIARNVDGSPKIIQQKEIEARARQRDQMIKDAIDNAIDDGSPTRLRDTGNGYYVGIPSPSQLNAIKELPNTLVTPYVKKNLLAFIEVMQRRDGTRILMEYQPALKKGKYRALSPKIRDVVPIGFRFTKAGNWLAVNVSVSRMFDKLDLWARTKPENLDLWGRSPAKFMDDVLRVLDSHNKNLAGQTNLDIDPDIALQKKNRVNDFFNMFTKDTEAANPSRTKLKARRGQESADRILMSARIDRINQMQISNAQKFPVDYGKMKINFLPGQPNGELRLDPSDDLEVENDLGFDVGPGARFLPGIRYTDLPDDPKKLMADFYLLNAMLTTLPTGWSMGKSYLGGSKGGEDTMFSPVTDPTGRYAGVRAEKYQDALDEAKQTLIPALHSKIQKAIYFAIGAEFRHIYDQVRTDTIPQDLVDSPFFQEYAKGLAVQGSKLFGLKKDPAPRRYKDESGGYLTSYVAMENARKKLGMSTADVARFAERMYREPKWNSSYGGDKWGDIAAHLAKMSDPSYSTERVRAVVTGEDGRLQIVETDEFRDPGAYEEMFKEIDRGYDLQHNTNTVFNKIKKYSLGSEGYKWIAEMLDFKANVGNPRELQRYVSGTMRRLSNVWFGDMRADAPLTQDLEESVKAQLPETFKTEAMGPQEFIDRLADLVGTYYRKSGSKVRVDRPFENIARAAERIQQKLVSAAFAAGDPGVNLNTLMVEAWNAIKKDQNAHIGLILEDNFGDLGIAQTDAVKLFRMLLNEGKDPRVTGKPAKRTPLNVPKPEKSFSPSALTEPVFKPTTQMVNFAAGSNVIGDGSGKGEWMMKLTAKNPAYSTLGLYKNGIKFKSYNVAISESSKKPLMGSVELATEMINKDIALNTPQQASDTAISPGDLLSPENIKESAKKILANWNSNKVGLGSVDILGHRFYLAPTGSSNAGFADLTVRKKNASGPAFGPATIIKTILLEKTSAQQIAEAIQEFQNWLGTAPAEYSKSGSVAKTQSGQWFIGNVFQPKLDKSVPSNLNEFVTGLLFNGFNGLKLGDITVVLAGGSGKATTFKVYQGDSVSESSLLTTATIPGGKKRDIVDWLAGYAEMQSKKQGFFTVADWMQQNLKMTLEMNPMPKKSQKVSDLIAVLPVTAALKVNQLIKDLQDIEWVDTNLANLPPSDIDASAEYVEALLLNNASAPAKAMITDSIGTGDIEALGKYLYDLGKWSSDKLEKRMLAGMTEEFDYKGLTPDSPAAGYPKSDGTLKTIAEVAAAVGPYEAGSNENHVYFTSSSGTAVTNPYEDDTGEAIVLPNDIAKDADIAKGQIMNFWSYQGIGPSEVETALAIFDAANPGHLYSKESGVVPPEESVAMAKNEVAAQKQAMEFLKDMLLEDPIELGGNTWELAVVEEDNDGNVMGAVVKLNGVAVSNTIPFDPSTTTPEVGNKAIYDDYFALDWMKDWKAPETQPLLSPDQDLMMQAASELVAAVAAGFVVKPEVVVINKTFSAEVNPQGNMVVTGYDENGNVIGTIPIQGSKTMDPIDLEAAVYEALDLLNANAAPYQPPKITPQAINEAAEALFNDETTTLGKYTLEPIASGLGGTKVNIYVESEGGDAFVEGGEQNPVSDFLLDPGEYREPSDMIDAFHDKITEFLENNPDLDDGTGGTGPGARFMPASGRSPIETLASHVYSADVEPADLAKAVKKLSRSLNPIKTYKNAYRRVENFPEGLKVGDVFDSGSAGWSADKDTFADGVLITYKNPRVEFDYKAALKKYREEEPRPMRDVVEFLMLDKELFMVPHQLKVVELNKDTAVVEATTEKATVARFMPGITPKTLYNFYHLATLESQGRIKSEYGQGLMREYLNTYKQKYLETLAPLVSDQIKKYIGRGRVDEPVTQEALDSSANDPVALDELMRQTYRSDMKRRNDVWNNITEHLKGLAAAGTPRDIIFRIDRLNNAIHNTNELLFSKFKNAGELMDAFEAINDARDERAYGRMVDKDLRDIEEFEGGPGARFMPASVEGTFYHGTPDTKNDITGTPFDPERVQKVGHFKKIAVGYLTPSLVQAQAFSKPYQEMMTKKEAKKEYPNAKVVKANLKNKKIFDPGNSNDLRRFEKTLFDMLVQQEKARRKSIPGYSPFSLKDDIVQAKMRATTIANDVADFGGVYGEKNSAETKWDSRGGAIQWQLVESWADVIQAAGFDGYLAYEDRLPAVALFLDNKNVTLEKFSNEKLPTAKITGGSTKKQKTIWPRKGGPIKIRPLNPKFMPGDQAMPGSSQVDQSLAGVTGPDTGQGPLSGARFMPREFSGETAWRGSYLNEQRRHGGDFGGGNYADYKIMNSGIRATLLRRFLKAFKKLGTTQVTYLAKDKDIAYDFAQQAKDESYRGEPGLKKLRVEKYKIRGKSTKLFDPLNAEDREKVAEVLKKKRIPENFAKRALKEITEIDEYDGNWKPIEMLAPAIKEAGFDGYIAMEYPEAETYGLFGDVAGMKDSMATPIRANSSGKNVRFMPGYNPRYTDDDGNFDRDAWLADVRKGEEYLRSRGITRANTEKDPYEQMLREALRGPRR
jgi:hypothetical protein